MAAHLRHFAGFATANSPRPLSAPSRPRAAFVFDIGENLRTMSKKQNPCPSRRLRWHAIRRGGRVLTRRCAAAIPTSSCPVGLMTMTLFASILVGHGWWAPARSVPRSRPCSPTAAPFRRGPNTFAKSNALASAVHHVLEKVEVSTAQGMAHAYVLATNVYKPHSQAGAWWYTRVPAGDRRRVARSRPTAAGAALRRARVGLHRTVVAARRPYADHLVRAVRTPSDSAGARLHRDALDQPGPRLH